MNCVAVGRDAPPEGWAREERWLWLDGGRDSGDGMASPYLARRSGGYRTAAQSYLMASEEANRLILAWAAEARDARGRSLNELTEYRGCSLWSAAEVTLLYTILADLVDRCRLWEHILDVEAPKTMWVGGHPDAALIGQVARARGIAVLEGPSAGAGSRPRTGCKKVSLGSWSFRIPTPLVQAARRQRRRILRWKAARHNRSHPKLGSKEQGGSLVLVLTLVRRFVDIVIPVIQVLQCDPRTTVIVVDKNFSTASALLEETRIPFLVWEGFCASSIERQCRVEADRFAREWQRLSHDERFRSHFQYHGISLWPFVESALAEDFLDFFPELVRVMETTQALLEAVRPDAVVLTDDRPPFQRVFVAACRAAGVPTVNIQNSVLADVAEGGPMTADWIAVDGEVARTNLVKRGTAAEKIVVTGQPRFDFLPDKDRRFDRRQIVRGLDLDPRRPVVLLASQWVGVFTREGDKRKALQAVYAAVKRIPDVQLVVKLHPDDRDGLVERSLTADAKLDCVRIVPRGDIWPLLYACDLAMVFFSTVGYEAIVMDRPLIQIHLEGAQAETYRFTDCGAALGVEKLETLEEAIRSALFNQAVQARLQEGRRAYVRAHAHALDGQAGRRVAELVRQVAGRKTVREPG